MKYWIALLCTLIVGCDQANDKTYTLYRTSLPLAQAAHPRVHVATFDARESEFYNQDNCQTAADLFWKQPGVETKFWCEKGKFKP